MLYQPPVWSTMETKDTLQLQYFESIARLLNLFQKFNSLASN